MRPLSLPLSATLLVLAMWGCGPQSSADRVAPSAPPTATKAVAQALNVPPAVWRAGTAGDEARLALLIAADRYLEPSWTIGSAANNLVAMRQALRSSCGMAAQGVVELTGTQVNRDAVKAGLSDLGRQIKGRKGVLMVYWTGHGFVDTKGEARWFTHYTRELASGGYDNVVSRAELAGWITEACGTGITPVIVADVCRPRINAPPPPATLEPLSLWELQSTRAGRYSEAPPPDQASPFTRAFADSLASLAQTGESGLEAVFAETSRRCKEATNGRQEPELIRPLTQLSDPGLVRSQRIAVEVEAVDAVGGRMIPGLSVRLDARPTGAAADGPQRLEAAAGRHTVRLSAPGYCARIEEIDLASERGGSTLRVALLPALVRLSGTVEPAGVYGVRLRGLDQAIRDGFHRVQTTSDGAGSFELRIPSAAEGIEVIITKGEQIVGRTTVPATLDRYRLVTEGGIEGIRLGDLGTVRVGSGGDDAVAKAAAGLSLVGTIPLPAGLRDLPRGVPVELTAMQERNRWDQAMRLVAAQKWSNAFDQFQPIAGKLPGDVRERWTAYLMVEKARTADLASATASVATTPAGLPRQAVAAVVVSRTLEGSPSPATLLAVARLEQELEPAAKAVAQTRRIALAAGQISAADPSALLDWLLPATGPGWADASWQAARHQGAATALGILATQAVERGIASDDWSLADRVATLTAAAPDVASDPVVAGGLQRIDHERQPAAARTAFGQAQDAFAGGDAAVAYDRYRTALTSGANPHYRAQILPQVEYLGQQLYIRHFNTGLEHEVEGRLAQAVTSYTSARAYDIAVRVDVERLRTQGGAAEGLATALAVYDTRYQSVDSQELAVQTAFDAAVADGTSLALRAAIRRFPDHQRASNLERLAIEADRKAATERKLADERAATAANSAADRAFSDGSRAALETFALRYPLHARVAEARRQLALTPVWSSGVGKDAFGSWARLVVGGQTQLMRFIPSGTFQMGSSNLREFDGPVHPVTLSGFWLGDSEVTQGMWQAVMGVNPSQFVGDAARPVEKVSSEDCQGFFQRLNSQVRGLTATFPSEAQWEYACRAGSGGDYAGDLGAMAWYRENAGGQTHPVKSKLANAFGLYDMHGNVEEWCSDYYAAYPAGAATNPRGVGFSSMRVSRGGHWNSNDEGCRSADRGANHPNSQIQVLGVRMAAQSTP